MEVEVEMEMEVEVHVAAGGGVIIQSTNLTTHLQVEYARTGVTNEPVSYAKTTHITQPTSKLGVIQPMQIHFESVGFNKAARALKYSSFDSDSLDK